MEELLKRTLQC